MTKKYMEYEEVMTPDEILTRLEKSVQQGGKPISFSEAGLFEWLNERAKKDGWRVVWQAWQGFPLVVFEREVVVEEVEN